MNVQHRRAPRAQTRRVFRIQDREGRGPFRPGFSQMWLDEDLGARVALPTWMEEFGTVVASEAMAAGYTVFSAVRAIEQLRNWFSDAERQRLYEFGYFLVEVPHALVIGESAHQVLCARELPLTYGVMNRRPM